VSHTWEREQKNHQMEEYIKNWTNLIIKDHPTAELFCSKDIIIHSEEDQTDFHVTIKQINISPTEIFRHSIFPKKGNRVIQVPLRVRLYTNPTTFRKIT